MHTTQEERKLRRNRLFSLQRTSQRQFFFFFFYHDASSAILQLANHWLNFTHSRSHAFRYERKNTNPTLVRIELTTSVAAYLLDHSGDELDWSIIGF